LKNSNINKSESFLDIENQAGEDLLKICYKERANDENFFGTFNELNIILLSDSSKYCIKKIISYFIDDEQETIYIYYESSKYFIKNLIEEEEISLNMEDRIRLFRNLLECVISIHLDGIVCLNISADSISINLNDGSIKFCNMSKLC